MKSQCHAGLLVLSLLGLTACGEDQRIVEGQKTFTANCKVCHAQGINGAPIVGNKKMWGPRITQGHEVLVSHALNGYGLMPARAGNPDLSDEEISNAVFYMMSTVQE